MQEEDHKAELDIQPDESHDSIEPFDPINEKDNHLVLWLRRHAILILIAVIAIVGLIIAIIFLSTPKPDEGTEDVSLVGEQLPAGVPEVPMEKDAYPSVDSLVHSYFEALARGDAETVRTLTRDLEDTEAKRIQVSGEYISEIPRLEIYVKKGLLPDTYIAYVINYVVFEGFEEQVPGLRTLYIRKGTDGSYYIEMGDVADNEDTYITGITLQQDVKDLNNRVAVEYNDLIAGNTELNNFLEDMKVVTRERVGEMIEEEKKQQQALEEQQAQEAQEASAGQEGGDGQEVFPKTAKVSTKINVRTSDSIEADRKGQLAEGQDVTVLENRPNGWSKISFEEGEGFVKTEYLVFSESQPVTQAEGGETPENTQEGIGYVTARENVNVRAKADQNSEKLGMVSGGDQLKLLERLDNGWCKVLYHDTEAYVNSDYVE